MSGRLNLAGALNRQSMFDDAPVASTTSSAAQARLERKLKEVQDENLKLSSQLEETRFTLDMLMKESSHENFDERRVNMLKCQLIQQERQILLLSESLGSRSSTLMEVENALSWLADMCRSQLSAEIPRADLTRMVDTAESARIKLFKNLENSSRDNLAKPMMFMNDFVHPWRGKDCSLFDIVSGKLDHINLKQVAHLESKLSSLYKELIRLHSLISDDKRTNQRLCSYHMTSVIKERFNTQVLQSCAMVKDCADDLLTLSLLYPSAPWPVLRRPLLKEVSVDQFMTSLPALPRSKSHDVHRLVEALIKVHNYRYHMLDREVRSLREEVKFHQSVYGLQLDYTTSMFDALRDGYREFEKSSAEVIVKPIKEVLNAYMELKTTTSEDALRKFLSAFKDNEQLFSETIDKLSVHQENGKDEKHAAISVFGEEFMTAVNKVVFDRQKKRDLEASERQDLKAEQKRLDDNLRALLKDIEFERSSSVDAENSTDRTSTENSSNVEVKVRTKNSKPIVRKSHSDLTISRRQLSPEDDNNRNENNQDDVFVSGRDSSCNNSARSGPSRAGYKSRLVPKFNESQLPINKMKDKDCGTEQSCVSALSDRTMSGLENKTLGIGAMPGVPRDLDSPVSAPKPSYKPKLYVANRTLRLRRSGSLNRLSSVSPVGSSGQAVDVDTDRSEVNSVKMQDPFINGEMFHGISTSKSDLPKLTKVPGRKPPFK